MKKVRLLLLISVLLTLTMAFSLSACGQSNNDPSVAIKYNKKKFYLGDTKTEIEKILGKPISEEDDSGYKTCVYIDTSESVIVKYDKEEKSKVIEVFSEQVTVSGLKIGDACNKVENMFPKFEYKWKSEYNEKLKMQVETVDGAYRIYMQNQQNIDKDSYDINKYNTQISCYCIEILYTPNNIANSELRKISGFIINE